MEDNSLLFSVRFFIKHKNPEMQTDVQSEQTQLTPSFCDLIV